MAGSYAISRELVNARPARVAQMCQLDGTRIHDQHQGHMREAPASALVRVSPGAVARGRAGVPGHARRCAVRRRPPERRRRRPPILGLVGGRDGARRAAAAGRRDARRREKSCERHHRGCGASACPLCPKSKRVGARGERARSVPWPGPARSRASSLTPGRRELHKCAN